jgi:hypothetical protein
METMSRSLPQRACGLQSLAVALRVSERPEHKNRKHRHLPLVIMSYDGDGDAVCWVQWDDLNQNEGRVTEDIDGLIKYVLPNDKHNLTAFFEPDAERSRVLVGSIGVGAQRKLNMHPVGSTSSYLFV